MTTSNKGDKLQVVIEKILMSSRKFPGKTPLLGSLGKPCKVCEQNQGMITPNNNGLMRTRFCNKAFSVHSLIFFCAALKEDVNHLSKSEQLEKITTVQKSISDDMEISHLCDTSNCVELTHMKLETRAYNMSRKGCVGYVLYDDTLVKVCKHEPTCIRVLPVDMKDVNTSHSTDDLRLLRLHGMKRIEHKEKFSSSVLEKRKLVKEKAVSSRSNVASSKDEKKEKRKQKLANKRKAKRKDRKKSKRQKITSDNYISK